jgi:hypothetical protein
LKQKDGQPQTQALLEISKRFNINHGLAGHIFLVGDAIVHYVEGSSTSLQEFYDTIQQDSLCLDSALIADGQLQQRLFSNWEMAYDTLDNQLLQAPSGHGMDEANTFEWLRANPSFCCGLFEAVSRNTN